MVEEWNDWYQREQGMQQGQGQGPVQQQPSVQIPYRQQGVTNYMEGGPWTGV